MAEEARHRGWHSRGYLPHLDAPKEIQAVTFRLADAMPGKLVEAWRRELEVVYGNASAGTAGVHTGSDGRRFRFEDRRSQALRQRIAHYEDAGYGECVLREPACAEVVQNALLHFDGERYRLLEWCIMPNHVHLLLQPFSEHALDRMVKSWKVFTAHKINDHLKRSGTLWARDYHDRYIRDGDHLANARAYIQKNPVKAGLCRQPEDWQWGSAGWKLQ